MPDKSKTEAACPHCNSKNAIKRGKRKRKFRVIQQFQCKDCNKFFSPQSQNNGQSNKTYQLGIILRSISAYNLGYNLNQTSERIEKKFRIKIPVSTLSSWLKEYKEICTFHRLRNQATKQYSQKTSSTAKPLTTSSHTLSNIIKPSSISYSTTSYTTTNFITLAYSMSR